MEKRQLITLIENLKVAVEGEMVRFQKSAVSSKPFTTSNGNTLRIRDLEARIMELQIELNSMSTE